MGKTFLSRNALKKIISKGIKKIHKKSKIFKEKRNIEGVPNPWKYFTLQREECKLEKKQTQTLDWRLEQKEEEIQK